MSPPKRNLKSSCSLHPHKKKPTLYYSSFLRKPVIADTPEKHIIIIRPILNTDAVIQDPNSNPTQKEFVMLYPIMNDNMSKTEPKHLSVPVNRKHNSVIVIIPPNTYNSHEISFT